MSLATVCVRAGLLYLLTLFNDQCYSLEDDKKNFVTGHETFQKRTRAKYISLLYLFRCTYLYTYNSFCYVCTNFEPLLVAATSKA